MMSRFLSTRNIIAFFGLCGVAMALSGHVWPGALIISLAVIGTAAEHFAGQSSGEPETTDELSSFDESQWHDDEIYPLASLEDDDEDDSYFGGERDQDGYPMT